MGVFEKNAKIREITLGLSSLKWHVSVFGWDVHAFNYVNNLTKAAVAISYRPASLVEMVAEALASVRATQKTLKLLKLEEESEEPSKLKETTEPDLYLFPEQVYNMTGWGNLNYGTSRY